MAANNNIFYLTKALENFSEAVINSARINLKNGGHNTFNNLTNSLDYSIQVNTNGNFSIDFEMEFYGDFLDKGVSGVKKKYNTEYSFKSKMPPPNKLDKWVVKKGIAPRDSKGKFIPRKSVNFLIARSIFLNGIKPSLFFTKAFDKNFSKVPDTLITALAQDADDFLNNIKINKLN